ncbi:MAG: phycobilisome rod-core linker polypeptide [Cyanobacteria bacterium J06598_3]
MQSTFINPVVNPDTSLGVTAFTDTTPVRHWSTSAGDELDAVVRAVYKQVLGNAYVMESERQHIPESQFRRGELTVVEFVRQVAKSSLYRTRFFENGPRNRFIELNFKHFLGRAPESLSELAAHSALLDDGGYDAEIDSYLDSDEYAQAFGDDTVPYYRGYKTEAMGRVVGFTHLFPLLRGASSSDKNVVSNHPARLTRALSRNIASVVVPPTGATTRQGTGGISTDDMLRALFNRPAPSATAAEPAESAFAGMGESALAEKSRAQAELITQLASQLDEVRSLSNMGAAILRKGQRPTAPKAEQPFGTQGVARATGAAATLESTVTEQAAKIEKLRGELMSARSLATIAESKLNRWRQRSY